LTWIKQPTEKLFSAEPEPRAGYVAFRGEERRDAQQIRDLLEASFPGFGEALLVDRLRHDGDLVLSLVAEDQGVVVGYIAFSRLVVEGPGQDFRAVALAPLAVYPEYQQQGIATRLVQEGHACLAALGETLSVVLGEPHFYGRFGYSNRRVARFESEYQSPYLMALSFGAAPVEGRLVYPPAFEALSENAPLQADDRV
jgi:putative acetyltransferase